MKDDERVEIYNEGVKEGQKHSEPSSLTKKFMEYMRDKIKSVCDDTNNLKKGYQHLEIANELMCKDIKDIKDDINELKTTLNTFINSADSRFASKKVENVLWAAGGIIGTSIVLALLRLIFKIEV
jgi:hypothetical protein